jgi:hypothetical protein
MSAMSMGRSIRARLSVGGSSLWFQMLVSTGPRADRGACVRCVKEQADRQGLVRKYRRFDSGKPWVASPSGAGGSITSSPNPVHVGEIRHKGTYPGHPRSIGAPGALPETWPGSIYGLEIRIVGDKGVIDIEDTHRDLCWLRRSHKGLATVRTASYSARRATSISSLPIRPATCTGQATPHATAAEGHRNLLLTMAMEPSARLGRPLSLLVETADLMAGEGSAGMTGRAARAPEAAAIPHSRPRR